MVPVLSALSALAGAWLGSRATLRAQRETADRQDAREDREQQAAVRATARLVRLELTENLSLLGLTLGTGAG